MLKNTVSCFIRILPNIGPLHHSFLCLEASPQEPELSRCLNHMLSHALIPALAHVSSPYRAFF